MIWILLLMLALWVGIGTVILFLGSRSVGTNYARSADKRICATDEEVKVSLQFVPPVATVPQKANDHDVVLTIDHSSSMGSGPGSPLREALRAAENFVRLLPGSIHVGVVQFDHDANLLCPIVGKKQQVLDAVGAIGSGGATAIDTALDVSRETLLTGRDGVPKTVIILSDGGSTHAPALAAADHIKALETAPRIISLGFGPHVDAALMTAIASEPDLYFHADSTEDLQAIFNGMARVISGQTATSGVVDEGIWDPAPFVIQATGGLFPVGVKPADPTATPADPTRVVWAIPVMDNERVSLTYDLKPQCVGWHAVASPDGEATWKMPDDSVERYGGPKGPKVLILPSWLKWAWPILNPLFWMLFGRFWPCVGKRERETLELPEPLPQPTLPELLPIPADPPYKPQLRPALVVGLGEVGEWTTCRLKHRLWDREVGEGVALYSVFVTHWANRVPAAVGHTMIEEHERITLHQDLRPYLETLRTDGVPSERAWVPWRRWLAESRPQTTARPITDRRQARLALLQKPEPLEHTLQKDIDRVIDQEGIVIVTGSVDDAECSGLLAEVAHICAAKGAGVTVVLATFATTRRLPGRYALAHELERMVLMRGRMIFSDRHKPDAKAKQLLDRIVIVEHGYEAPSEAATPTAELIWDMLAYEEVFDALPLSKARDQEVSCCAVEVDGEAFPVRSLWEWVRENTLASEINERWLRLQEKPDRYVLPPVDQETLARDVERFWTGNGLNRAPSFLIISARSIIDVNNPNPLVTLLTLQDELPVEEAYHKQAWYSRVQLQQTNVYLEEWIHSILTREREHGVWGLPILLTAVLRIEQNVKDIVASINRMSGNTDFTRLVNFASSMYTDLLSAVEHVRSQLAQWVARFTGPHLNLHVEPLGEAHLPVCYDIEKAREQAERGLVVQGEQVRAALEKHFERWKQDHGKILLEQLQFRVGLEADNTHLTIKLYLADQQIDPRAEVAEELRTFLDRYRSVTLGWSLEEAVLRKRFNNLLNRYRIGKHAERLYPQLREVLNEEDPYVLISLRLERKRPLKDALGATVKIYEELPYAWPEEANAARIAEKIRNVERRDPVSFTAFAIHMMYDTRTLHSFMSDLAQQRIVPQGTKFILQRNGNTYNIGPENDTLQGVEAFESVLQQVVSLGVSLEGQPLPKPSSPWKVSAGEAVSMVEAHPLAREATNDVGWKMWRDVILGLALEHGRS